MKVLVAGFFDMLHSGHIQFFKKASKYGDLYVCIGNDKNLMLQKKVKPICTEKERLFMVKSIKYVKDAFISKYKGNLDFAGSIKKINPDIFCINTDGDTNLKRNVCNANGVYYKVLKRKTIFKKRSSTDFR